MRYLTLRTTRTLLRRRVLGRGLSARRSAELESAGRRVLAKQRVDPADVLGLAALIRWAAAALLLIAFVPTVVALLVLSSAFPAPAGDAPFHLWAAVAFVPMGVAIGNLLLYSAKLGLLRIRYPRLRVRSQSKALTSRSAGMIKPYDFLLGTALGVFLTTCAAAAIGAAPAAR